MKKFIICLSLFFVAIVLLCCKENQVDVVKEDLSNKNKSRESDARMGPGYSWNFSTSSLPGDYVDPPSGTRQYFLKASLGYSRSVTLTVQKVSASSENPQFRYYGNEPQKVKFTSPTISSGTSAATSWTDYWTGMNYSGFSWAPNLASSPVGTSVTCTFNAYIPAGSSGVEGFVKADMTYPVLIPSAANYWDGDYLYFVKSSL